MELLDGEILSQRIRRGNLTAEEVLRYGQQIAGALAEAHSKGIVHRDLKPGNIMLTRNGLKVLDFGLAKLSEGAGQTLTQSHAMMGTPAYMAPEQVRGEPAGPAADLFALGLVLYEMAEGKLPIPGVSLGTTQAHGTPIKIPSVSRTDLPSAVRALIPRLLEAEPSRRPGSAAEVRDALAASGESKSRARPAALLPALAGALAIILLGVWWIVSRSSSSGHDLEVASVHALASLPGVESYPAVSPDGSTVVFTWNGEAGDRAGLYAIPLNGGSYRQLTFQNRRDFASAWSPDGRQIAFLRGLLTHQLILLDVASGQERILIADVKSGSQVDPIPAWTADGTGLIVPMSDFETGKTSLFLVNALVNGKDASARRLFPSPPGQEGDSQPSFSRDGRWLAYITVNSPISVQLFVRRMGKDLRPEGAPIPVPGVNGRLSRAVWAPRGDRLYVGRNGQIIEWSRGGGTRRVYSASTVVGGLSAAWTGVGPRFVVGPTPLAQDVRSLMN